MGYEMERPSVKELSEKFKAEERKDRAKITRPQLRPCDPKYQPTMDKHCKKLHDYFYPKAEPSQKYFKRKDTQVRIRLNVLKRYCKELINLADELESAIKSGNIPYHIKDTAMKMISYIKAIKMKFCPKCETRTNKEYTICPLCGVKLIDKEKSIQKAKEQLKEIDELENKKDKDEFSSI